MGSRQCLLAVMLGGLLASAQVEAQTKVPLETAGRRRARCGATPPTPIPGARTSAARRAPMRRSSATWCRRSRRSARDETGVEFDIVGSKDGWLLIRTAAMAASSSMPRTGPTAAAGSRPGWSAPVARAGLPLGAAARCAGDRALPGDNWGPDSAGVWAVHGCQGRYIEVTARPSAARRCAAGPISRAPAS